MKTVSKLSDRQARLARIWDTISDKDELHRLKICRKEAKESRHWLSLLYIPETEVKMEEERQRLVQEAYELTKIFGSIVSDKEGTRIEPEAESKNDFSHE